MRWLNCFVRLYIGRYSIGGGIFAFSSCQKPTESQIYAYVHLSQITVGFKLVRA